MGRAFLNIPRALSLSLIPSLRSASIQDQGRGPLWRNALLARHEIFPTLQGDLNH